MRLHHVIRPDQAVTYLTDCTLATVCDLAGKKSKSKGEYRRQKWIAQIGIDWIKAFGWECNGRPDEVIRKFNGSVDAWAIQFEPK